MRLSRRTTVALAGLILWIGGLAFLVVVAPRAVLPAVGGLIALVALMVARAHLRQQAAIGELRASLRALRRSRSNEDDAFRRLYAEMLAARDLHASFTLAIRQIDTAVNRLAVGGSDVAPSALFHQVEALVGLYSVMRPRRELPRLGVWPTSPEMLLFLYAEVRSRRPSLVVECGSGVSTLVIGYALEQNGSGRLVSLEHDVTYFAKTTRLVADHALTAEVRHAPLQEAELDGVAYQWYDLGALPDGPVSMVFVDGPPGNLGPRARYPALPLLAERMAAQAVVVVDDYDRTDERDVVASWLAAYPDWSLEELEVDRGGAVLRRA